MENLKVQLPESLHSATEILIENLLGAEPFILYDRAQTRLNTDRQAMKLLEQLSTGQANIRKKQGNGSVTQPEVEHLRALQNEIQQNQTIMEYAQAQQAAVNYLREINQEISQLLGLDFASLARRSTC